MSNEYGEQTGRVKTIVPVTQVVIVMTRGGIHGGNDVDASSSRTDSAASRMVSSVIKINLLKLCVYMRIFP